MRDPARIDNILTILRDLWYRYPDQRLGQLLINYAVHDRRGVTLFTEDDKIEENLLNALQSAKDPHRDAAIASINDATGKTFNVGDIVDWEVIGSGGPGYVMGHIECEVIHTSLNSTELTVRPISWEEAWEVLEKEYEFQDFLEDFKHGGLENVGAEHCSLVKINNIEVKDNPDCVTIEFKVKEESRVLYRAVSGTLNKNIPVKDKLVLEQIASQLKKTLES